MSLDNSPTLPESLSRVGRYEVLSELGRGSMGRVYLAEDPNIGRKVAVKVLFPAAHLDPKLQEDFHQRFLVEARAAGRFHHPGIVTIYDADLDPATGLPFIAMEWVDGEPLEAVLGRVVRLDLEVAAAYGAQVALALDYAHLEGVIHRDIKPANVLIREDGRVKVMDFGIAKLGGATQTVAGQILGTPAYMSPEQVRGEQLDGRSDLFSLGVILYQALTGRHPFLADSIPAITYKIVHQDVPRMEETAPDLPPALREVVRRTLDKDRTARFSSGAELADALASAAGIPLPSSLDSTGTHLNARTPRSGPLDDTASTLRLDEAALPASLDTTSGTAPVAASVIETGRRSRWKWVVPAVVLATFLIFLGWPDTEDDPIDDGLGTSATSEAALEEPLPPPSLPAAVPNLEPSSAPPSTGAPRPVDSSSAPPILDAKLILSHKKWQRIRLKVELDGQEVWTYDPSQAEGQNLIEAVLGGEMSVQVPLASGEHQLTVRLEDDRDLRLVENVQFGIGSSESRTLRVDFKRRARELELDWGG